MTSPDEPTADFWRRVRVLVARQRIERLSRQLLTDAEGRSPAERRHGDVKARLLLLTAGVPAERWWETYLLAQRAGAVYEGTSSVLHGRRAFGDVPEVLVQEWEELAAELEDAVKPCEDPQEMI